MKPMQTTYDPITDMWTFFVPHGLPISAIEAAKQYVLKINKDRWLGASGPMKEKFAVGIKALENNRIKQHIVTKGDVTLFQSTEKQYPQRLIVDLGAK